MQGAIEPALVKAPGNLPVLGLERFVLAAPGLAMKHPDPQALPRRQLLMLGVNGSHRPILRPDEGPVEGRCALGVGAVAERGEHPVDDGRAVEADLVPQQVRLAVGDVAVRQADAHDPRPVAVQ